MFRLNAKFIREVRKRYVAAVTPSPQALQNEDLTDPEYNDIDYDDYDYRESDWTEKDWQRIRDPSVNTIRKLIEVCFWASLEREEGRNTDFHIMLSPPPADRDLYRFKESVPFEIGQLAKLAPAVHPALSILGVWFEGEGTRLKVWGLTSRYRERWLSVKTYGSGQLILKIIGDTSRGLRFSRDQVRALITGSKSCFLDETNPFYQSQRDGSRFGLPRIIGLRKFEHKLRTAAEFMWRYGHGGTLLVVPNDDENWKTSFKELIPYAPHKEI